MRKNYITLFMFLIMFSLTSLLSCQENEPIEDLEEELVEEDEVDDTDNWIPLTVKASAYNSIEAQTKKGNVGLAAWGDVLKPGVKAIAVSNDLLRMGLTHNTRVKIEGLEGIYLVKDKMHSRWRNKIDIYMGVDVRKARRWGVQKVNILYAPPEE